VVIPEINTVKSRYRVGFCKGNSPYGIYPQPLPTGKGLLREGDGVSRYILDFYLAATLLIIAGNKGVGNQKKIKRERLATLAALSVKKWR
jgi:hypothetical protein